MVDSTSGAAAVLGGANKLNIQPYDALKTQQEIENLKSTQLSNKKNQFGMDQDQINFTNKNIAALLADPNITTEKALAQLDYLHSSGATPNEQAYQTARAKLSQAQDPGTLRAQLGMMLQQIQSPETLLSRNTNSNVHYRNGGTTQFGTMPGANMPNAGVPSFAPSGSIADTPGAHTYSDGQHMVGVAGGTVGEQGVTGLVPATQSVGDATWTDSEGKVYQGTVNQRAGAVGQGHLTGSNPYGAAPGATGAPGNPYGSGKYPVPGQGSTGLQPAQPGRPAPAPNAPPTPGSQPPGAPATPPGAPATPPGAPATPAPDSPPATTSAGGGPITVDPLQQENNKRDNSLYRNVVENSQKSRDGINALTNARDALQIALTGPGSAKPADVLAKLNTALGALGGRSDYLDAKTAARDLAAKYLTDYARNSMGSLNTNAGLDAANHANASVDVNNTAALDVVKSNIGKERMVQAIAGKQTDQTGRGFGQLVAKLNKDWDYRAFSLDMYSPAELKELTTRMTDDERKKFYKSVAVAKTSGLLNIGRKNQYLPVEQNAGDEPIGGLSRQNQPPAPSNPLQPPASTNPLLPR